MKRNSSLVLIAALLAGSVPARAIELSLEENRAERGSVGFVDMQRLFKASPDASRAREGLEELVRQAEERVNSKKADLLRLRSDLTRLKAEREELAKSTPTAIVPLDVPPPAPAPAVVPAPSAIPLPPKVEEKKPVEAPKVEPAKVTPEKPAVPVTEAAPETAAAPLKRSPLAPTPAAPAKGDQLTINLPGLTDGPLNLDRPGASPMNPSAEREAKPAEGPKQDTAAVVPPKPEPPKEPVKAPEPPKAPVPAAVAVSTPPAPAQAALPPAPKGPTVAQRLIELDGIIAGKQADIDRLQAELDRERLGAEKSLLDAESRKTDQVLARLYRAISETAKREGISVVVDKSATLYGHPAMDLTDKVLRQLKGAIPPQ